MQSNVLVEALGRSLDYIEAVVLKQNILKPKSKLEETMSKIDLPEKVTPREFARGLVHTLYQEI